jgi:hypothetical protein
MFTIDYIFETLIISTVLTIFVAYNNFRMRRKLNNNLAEECKTKMSYFLKHPLQSIMFNFGLFFIVTFLLKWLNHILFGAPKCLNIVKLF